MEVFVWGIGRRDTFENICATKGSASLVALLRYSPASGVKFSIVGLLISLGLALTDFIMNDHLC